MLLWQEVLSKAVLVVPAQREGEERVLEERVLEERVLEERVREEHVREERVREERVRGEHARGEHVREAHDHHVLEVLSKAVLVPAPHEGEVRLGLVALDHQQGQGEAFLLLHRLAWEVHAHQQEQVVVVHPSQQEQADHESRVLVVDGKQELVPEVDL